MRKTREAEAPKMRSRMISAIAALAVVGAVAAAGGYGYGAIASQPVKRVTFTGDIERLPREELLAFERGIVAAPTGVAVAAVREAARRIPWVRDARVRRRFPDAIDVHFEAHEVLARWGDGALVSTSGEIFAADFEGELPRFSGPDGGAAAMAQRFPALARALAPLRTPIVELRLSPRGAWQVTLASGTVLDLGRGDFEPRVARFVAAWPSLASRPDSAHVDLRYPNGFAVQGRRKKTAPT